MTKLKMWLKYDVRDFFHYWLIRKHPPRNINRVRWYFDYYVGRNPLGAPYYGIWCIGNAYHNTGLEEWIRRLKTK